MINPIIGDTGNPNVTGQNTFMVGSNAVFFFDFPDIDGNLYDPSDINITINDNNGSTVKTDDKLDRLELGQYAYAWVIPSNTASGKYSIILDYVAETDTGPVSRSHSEDFVISETERPVFDNFLLGMASLLEMFIGETQHIPVYDEIGRLNLAKTEAKFTFPRWNQPAGAQVFVNGTQAEMSYNINYIDGKILFDVPLAPIDEVSARYNFRWFTDNEIHAFINSGISIFNQFPPQSAYNSTNIPDRYRITAVMQGAVFAIRSLIFSLMFQSPAKIFGGMDRADKIMDNLDQQKKNYEDQLKLLFEAKLKQPYVGLTKTITVPEFTLPAGRSRWFRYLFKGA